MSENTTRESEGIILEDQLIDHLATPDGAMFLYNERFSEKLINPNENDIITVFRFVMSYIDSNKTPPEREVIEYEFPVEFCEPKCDIKWLIHQFRERYKRNEVSMVLKKAARIAMSDPGDAVDLLSAQVELIRKETLSRSIKVDTQDFAIALQSYKDKIHNGELQGITFGFPDIDHAIGGIRVNTMNFIVARPKRYKSWFLTKSAVEAALGGTKVGIFSLELSKEAMLDRVYCMMAGVSWTRFYHGSLSPDEFLRMRQVADESQELVSNLIIYHPDLKDRSVPAMRQIAREDDIQIAYIDQLSFIRPPSHLIGQARHTCIEHIVYELKDMTEDFPVVCAAQFNREAATLSEMADLSKIGLSDSIGQAADLVMGLNQTKEQRQSNIIEFGVVESRASEIARFEIQVDLTKTSNFHFMSRIDDW